ncbi:MAG: hypothetical protein R8M14_09265, partial [Ghiorsea sp.]
NLTLTQTASATPAFSRQINADCRTCHMMGMYGLNKFGRKFKLNAFSLSKEMRDELLERRKQKHADKLSENK